MYNTAHDSFITIKKTNCEALMSTIEKQLINE